MTLEEYLQDYALEDTKKKGENVIQKELNGITNLLVRQRATEKIGKIKEGERDFRF